MAQPVKSFVSHVFAPVTKAISQAFTLPAAITNPLGGQGVPTNPPAPPPAAQQATAPVTQPGQSAGGGAQAPQSQFSFLSAASKAAAAGIAQGGGATGKSLIGA